jgi:uncharacterized protein (TIGR02599 family)
MIESSSHLEQRLRQGFTLIEILISTAIMTIILIAVASTIGMVSSSYRRTMGGFDTFEAAQTAFDTIGRTARQAVLQSYIGYDNPTLPQRSLLRSDLHFVIDNQASLGLSNTKADASHALFFQAPLGISFRFQKAKQLLASTGFFILHGEDPLRPEFLDTLGAPVENRHRYRLYQFIQPREEMTVYQKTISKVGDIHGSAADYDGYEWFNDAINNKRSIHAIAENIVALVIWPIHEGQPKDQWNSRDSSSAASHSHHRLPQALELTMVALDESSAIQLESLSVDLTEDLFENADNYEDDLKTLEDRLIKEHLTYRVFKNYVPLDAANTHL